jgi:hypothetical protein
MVSTNNSLLSISFNTIDVKDTYDDLRCANRSYIGLKTCFSSHNHYQNHPIGKLSD